MILKISTFKTDHEFCVGQSYYVLRTLYGTSPLVFAQVQIVASRRNGNIPVAQNSNSSIISAVFEISVLWCIAGPLYSLGMGTLGTTADDLERRLKEILNLSAKGNAIILLDEADSFLEKRSSTSSLERNAMVCVMLQLVEYFSGILFLTSNRIDSLDPAFQTRITLSLPYHDLTECGRQKIWVNLLHKTGVLPHCQHPSEEE